MRKPTEVLCVDEQAGLRYLSELLAGKYLVHTARSGSEALDVLLSRSSICVVLCDSQLQDTDSMSFLQQVQSISPTAIRLLVTTLGDAHSATVALHNGLAFRVLHKPYTPESVVFAFESAAEQSRLIGAERELLNDTLVGALTALMRLLASANPLAFERALRVERLVQGIVSQSKELATWPWEVAALMCQVGCMKLPESLLVKLNGGQTLEPDEQREYAQGVQSAITELANVPHLEQVVEILGHLREPPQHIEALREPIGARALRIALDYDTLEARGWLAKDIMSTLRFQVKLYDGRLVSALDASMHRGEGDSTTAESTPTLQ